MIYHLEKQIHTFGFGYNLDSHLLADISRTGDGTFSFIPDAKIVGTCFVNAVANLCSTMGANAEVYIKPLNGAFFKPQTIPLGPLYYGQKRDTTISVSLPPNLVDSDQPYLQISLGYNGNHDLFMKDVAARKPTVNAMAARARHDFLEALSMALGGASLQNKQKAMAGLVEKIDQVG